MTREEAINYLVSSGFSEEQINEIVKALEQDTISGERGLRNDTEICKKTH